MNSLKEPSFDDDLQAIRLLKQGNISGLETLVGRYQVRAIRTAFLILHDSQMAEDVVQDTFLRILNHIQRFDESRPFGPYLLRSVVNSALDAARNETKRRFFEGHLDSVEDLFKLAETTESKIEFDLLKRKLAEALARLSPRQRAAIVMRYYLDLSEKEMAESLNAAPGTVKWLLSAARERLRRLLRAERGPE
jgi:RNA polymerase sigma-70 factor, ECF subfamily